MPTTGSDAPVEITMGPRSYEVTVTYCLNTAICVTNNVRHITVEVVYRDEIIYEVETVYAQLR